jgi:Mn2+/Fe2+ NRAMP family transporter
VVVTEFVGIGTAAELFGVSRWIAVPLCAGLIWYTVIAGSYAAVERGFLLMTLAFLAYPISMVMAQPDWGAVARGTFVPSVRLDPAFMSLMVALIGTTITPYMQLFQQSAVVEKGVSRRRYGPERVDARVGAVLGNAVAACIVIASAATLHSAGMTDIQTAEDAARALEPAAGEAAQALFGIGLLGASILAAAVLPLATAYAISEAFGFRKGVNLDFRRAPHFMAIFSVVMFGAAAVALIPGLPLIELLIGIQVLNGMLLPVVLVFMLLLINDRRLMGGLRNSRIHNGIAWTGVVLITLAAAANVVMTLFVGS